MGTRVRRHPRAHVEPPGGEGGGASKRSMATKHGVFQTWATGAARLHTCKQNACLCAGQMKQHICLYTQHIQMEQQVQAMDLAFGTCSKVVHKITQYRIATCTAHTELNTYSHRFGHDVMKCVLPVQLKQQLWICRQEARIYITFELLKDARYLAGVQHLGQSMQLCIFLSVGQMPGAFASTSPGLGCLTGPTIILHVL